MRSIPKIIFCIGTIFSISTSTALVSNATIVYETWNATVSLMSGAADMYFNNNDLFTWTVIYDDEGTIHHSYIDGVWEEHDVEFDPPTHGPITFFYSDSSMFFNEQLSNWIEDTTVVDSPGTRYFSHRWHEPGWAGGYYRSPEVDFMFEYDFDHNWLMVEGSLQGALYLTDTSTHRHSPTPEPTTMFLFTAGLVGLTVFKVSRKNKL